MAGRITFQGAIGRDPGRAYTPFEIQQINSQNVTLAANRLMGGSQPISGYHATLSDGMFFQDQQTKSLGFWCDSTFYAKENQCTSEQDQAILQYRRNNPDSAVRMRARTDMSVANEKNRQAEGNKYAAYVMSSSTPPGVREDVRKALIAAHLIAAPLLPESVTNLLTIGTGEGLTNSLIAFYSGPLTVGTVEYYKSIGLAYPIPYTPPAKVYTAEEQAAEWMASQKAAAAALELSRRQALLIPKQESLELRNQNGAKADDYTNMYLSQSKIALDSEARMLSIRKENLAASDSLAKAVNVQSNGLRGPSGTTPVASKKKNKKVARSSVSKLKKNNRR